MKRINFCALMIGDPNGKMDLSWPLGISRNGPASKKSYLGHIIIFEAITGVYVDPAYSAKTVRY